VNNSAIKILGRVREFIYYLIVILFPLNQQLHLRPFPSIDGRIIDYLIIKISIVEVFLICFTILNIPNLIKLFIDLYKKHFQFLIGFLSLLLLVSLNTYVSKYPLLSIYENLVILLIILNSLTLGNLNWNVAYNLLHKSLKIWMILLVILGFLQVIYQSSILNSYKFFGEFPYESSNYHIKQDGLLFDNLIPAYGIFSHSNIYGAFFLCSLMFLFLLKKQTPLHIIIGSLGVLLSGSLNILICLSLFLIFFYFKLNSKLLYLYLILSFIVLNILSFDFQKYEGNHSIYRRIYMTNISNEYFYQKPVNFIFGFGYYNYFTEVAERLYRYEIIRFFQPPHNLIYLLIWNYGIIFVTILAYLWFKFSKSTHSSYQLLFLVILAVSMFDHFFFTNHQLKMLVFLILPYSLKGEFGIRIS